MKVNKKVSKILGSSTLAITARVKELRKNGIDVINFAAGEPDFDTPDFIKTAAIEAIQKGFTKYTPSTGIVELKEAICQRFKKDNHLSYQPSQVIVSCGAKHSIYNLIQVLVDSRDEVIYQSPYWVSYPEMIKLAGGKSKIIKTSVEDNFKITPKQLSKSISKHTKVLILNSPSNPTGTVYTKSELEAMAEICVKNNIFVISDEIYDRLIYGVEPYVSIASLGRDIYNLTATVNGVSKTFSMTGWRIGYCGVTVEVADHIQRFQDHTTSNPCSISQMAALAALKASAESVIRMREEFKRRRDLMCARLDEIRELIYAPPEGAFYVFCDISRLNMDSVTVSKRILDEVSVAVIPGDGFGADNYIRLSFATSLEQIEEGMKRIKSWIENLARPRSKVSIMTYN